jgi:hypothetical protein
MLRLKQWQGPRLTRGPGWLKPPRRPAEGAERRRGANEKRGSRQAAQPPAARPVQEHARELRNWWIEEMLA